MSQYPEQTVTITTPGVNQYPEETVTINGSSVPVGPQANATTNGYLSSTDFIKFNSLVTDSQIYYHFPVVAGVVENDIVMNQTSLITSQAPLSFKQAVNGDNNYYAQIYGIAKNVSSGFADIYLGNGSVVSGFNFGAFIGVDYYLDPANPGKLTFTPPAVGNNINQIKVGRALSATQLILEVVGNFIEVKGGLYTSDGTYDEVLSVGANGNVVVADSTQAVGLKYAPAVVASAPFTYTTSTRALTIATATNSVAGVLSAADHTTFAAAAPKASPVFTGDVNSSTGNILVSTIGKGLQVKTGANSKVGTAVLSAGSATVANTSITANSRIFVTSNTDGGTPGWLRVSTKTVGTSFVITSSSATDTSTVAWVIVESIP